ncbi:Rossmann-like and DUF2520 domain-containing protein [Yimella sp. cx-51]|uniref:Rossmann-like and DUF2520 domain-containing protein n=1 Tax=Yimella sp. cx-51 TaxID=2770551 RepID=UPI00165DA262|nr:Rossmann-like and DUF2520 domain-containing protein [Yimella sp. cx-51]MBC9956383.1 DUF2520 domain-containing protein [Yimella sp. cx-51]QTH38498.1 DUF2520 domain-containing protein [Yimella sp. cx-51]
MEQPPALRIGVVGVGKVGAVLGAAFRAAGHEIVAASAVSEASRERARQLLPGVPIVPIPEVIAAVDVVLMTVPDDALAPLASGLGTENAWHGGKLVVHTSGFHGPSVLQPVLDAGGDVVAMHPAMTFTGEARDLARIIGTPFAVTGSPGAQLIGEALVVDLGGDPFALHEDDRARYHAALAHGSNHLVTLVGQSQQVLREVGIDDPSRILRPLLEASLENALERGDKALTGPVARGDVDTVRAHLGVLTQDVRMAYRAMARATLERTARRRALPAETVAPLTALLSQEDA